MREEILRISEVTYEEQGSVLLEDFSLNVFAGEIVGLIPRNGHGMTALIELLRYNPPLRAGYVYYREELVNSWRAPKAHVSRIGVIQNKSCLVGGLTVADNIFVLRPGFKAWLIHPDVLIRQVQPVLDSLGLDVRADAYASTLSTFQRVVVELVKAVVVGCSLVILREIGTIISDQEMARLREILRRYAAQGISFLYIDLHYEDMVQICDRTAVFSNGRIIKILTHQDGMPYEEMYLRRVREQMSHQEPVSAVRPALEVCDLYGGEVKGLSFQAAAGECVVLQDLQNLIFDDLISMLLGEKPISAGKIRVDGRAHDGSRLRQIAVIRERPDISMIFGEMSYLDNLCMTMDHRLPEIWHDRRLRAGLRREWAQRVGEEVFDILPTELSKRQKYDLVYQRILLQRPKVVFCVQPFSSADVDMRMHIWELLKELMNSGIALVILAVNLADTFTVATRLVRVEQGRACEVYEQRDFDRLPFSAPWLDLYRKDGEPCSGGSRTMR